VTPLVGRHNDDNDNDDDDDCVLMQKNRPPVINRVNRRDCPAPQSS